MFDAGSHQASLRELAPRLSMRVAQRTTRSANLVGRSIGADLYAWYGLEAPPRDLRFLTVDYLANADLELEELHAHAVSNLWRRLAGVACHRRDDREPFRLHAPEGLAASTLVLADLWSAIADGEVQGDVIVRVVNASTVYFAGSHETTALSRLESGSSRLLRLTPRGWTLYAEQVARAA